MSRFHFPLFSKINISILEIFKRKIKLKDQSRYGSGRRYCNIYQMMCDCRCIKINNYKLTSKKEETTSLCPNTVLFSLCMSVTSLSLFELEMSPQTQVWNMWSPAGNIILGSDGIIRRCGLAGRSRLWGAYFVSGSLPHSHSLSDMS